MPEVLDGVNLELFCPHCNKTKNVLKCCNRNMNVDLRDMTFFCPICGREEKIESCCGHIMELRKKGEIPQSS